MKSINSISYIEKFIKFFNSKEINKIAYITGFKKREGKLKASTFVKAISLGVWDLNHITLENIVAKCQIIQNGLSLSKQSLHERMQNAVEFMEQMFLCAIQYTMNEVTNDVHVKFFNIFSDVKIIDSSSINLPSKLKELWKGYGTAGHVSGIKLQAVYSLKYRILHSIKLQNQTDCDRKYANIIPDLMNPNELLLADLGYYSIRCLKKLVNKGVKFISRVKSNTIFSISCDIEKTGYKKIDLIKVLEQSNGFIDQYIYIGGKEKLRLKVRIVGQKLPESIVSERIRKARKKQKSQGRQLTKEHKEFLKWNLMITNIPKEILNSHGIFEIYRSRWQIELLFKTFKSILEIDNVGNMGNAYMQCILYGKLIAFILISSLYNKYNHMFFNSNKGRELSIQKFYARTRAYLGEILKSLKLKKENVKRVHEIMLQISKLSVMTLRKKRKTTFQRLRDIAFPSSWIILGHYHEFSLT